MNVLVTALGSFSAEAVIKSIKKDLFCTVIGTDINPGEWLANSKLVDKIYWTPLATTGDLYIKRILKICQEESIEFISDAVFTVCNDSASAHMAAFVNRPAFVIFGPTTLSLGFRPWNDESRVIEKNLECRP